MVVGATWAGAYIELRHEEQCSVMFINQSLTMHPKLARY